MFLDKSVGSPDLAGGHSEIPRQLNSWPEPELRLPSLAIDMNVHPTFLAREEVEAKPSCSKDGWAQADPPLHSSPADLNTSAFGTCDFVWKTVQR